RLHETSLLTDLLRETIKKKQGSVALNWAHEFGLPAAAVAALICWLITTRQFVLARDWARELSRGDHNVLRDGIHALLKMNRAELAAEWVMEFKLVDCFPPPELVRRMMKANHFRAAADWARKLNLTDSKLLLSIARGLMKTTSLKATARWIQEFN